MLPDSIKLLVRFTVPTTCDCARRAAVAAPLPAENSNQTMPALQGMAACFLPLPVVDGAASSCQTVTSSYPATVATSGALNVLCGPWMDSCWYIIRLWTVQK